MLNHSGLWIIIFLLFSEFSLTGYRLLLDNVDGWIKPGQMTALMGYVLKIAIRCSRASSVSGAGKTTLLDVLAKRKTVGKVEGNILLNGRTPEIDFERITGYVEQMDVFNPSLVSLSKRFCESFLLILCYRQYMRLCCFLPDSDKKLMWVIRTRKIM